MSKNRLVALRCIVLTLVCISVFMVGSRDSKAEKYNGIETMVLTKTLSMHPKESVGISLNYYMRADNVNNTFKFKWFSSNKKVATVDNGVVVAVSVGKAVITVKSGTASAKCKVTVTLSATQKKVIKKVKSVVKKNITSNMSKAEKVKIVHDYIVSTTAYDYDNYLAGTIPMSSYDSSGVLLNKVAVCQGYAEAFKLFMDELKIKCDVVVGAVSEGPHAWNIVKIGDLWYWVDTTWDDPVPNGDIIHSNYLLVSDKELEIDHVWDKSKYSAKGKKKY